MLTVRRNLNILAYFPMTKYVLFVDDIARLHQCGFEWKVNSDSLDVQCGNMVSAQRDSDHRL